MANITDRAAALFDGGWRSEDKEELMRVYELTEREAAEICEELDAIDTVIYRIEMSEMDLETNSYTLKNVVESSGECALRECPAKLAEALPDASELDEGVDIRYRLIATVHSEDVKMIEHWVRRDDGEDLVWTEL